ncbi:hypothetical protein SAMN02990966_07794 [Rhodospirillales bacterium URHD0017]|nr:hypothetical protein SAMN02990966_07794 [Rhodospirillales bacterium URHD0017]
MNAAAARVVFLGPSLDANEAATRLEARYLPPIRRGDLPQVIAEGTRSIGIIDGEFGQSLAVSVMEICAGLRQGIRIWGAASMGALRAAECQSVGMVGVGWIFQQYAGGHLRNDDEVALLFSSHDLRAITIPLVNIRWALQLAIEEGVLSKSSAAALIPLARSVRFKARRHEVLLEAASGSAWYSGMRTLVEFMRQNPLRTDRKRLDALLLLDAVHESAPTDPIHASP